MKYKRKRFLKIPCLLVLLVFSVFTAYSQGRITLTGTVFDATGQPLMGANVAVKADNQTKTVTDKDGKFTLSVTNPGVTLVVSYLSMVTQEIKANGAVPLKITLQDDNKMLSDVIIVGYGQQRKETLIGAVTQTNAKALERTGGVTNLGMALAGNLPGVTVSSSSGMPGAEDPQILIRAQTTWNYSAPLVMVDGVERPLSAIDIGSVETVSVLKDAAATAVYGVKGANGVILITTKTGSVGKAQIRARANTTVKTVSKLPAKYDSYDALSLKNRVSERELSTDYTLWPSNFTPGAILYKYRYPANADEWDRYPNTDWEKELFRDYAMAYGANVSISGGAKGVTYFASADYVSEGDLLKTFNNNKGYNSGYNYDRLNFRSNLDFDLTKTTKLSTKLFGSNGVRRFPWGKPNGNNNSATFAWTAAYRSAPDAMRPIYSDGTYGFFPNATFDVPNSIADLANAGQETNTSTQITTDFILNQDLRMITKGLKLRLSYSYDNTFSESGRGINDTNNPFQAKWINPITGAVQYSQTTDPNTQLDFYERVNWSAAAGSVDVGSTYRRLNYSAQLDYNRSFGKHDVGLTGVFMRERIAQGSVFPRFREDWVFRTTYKFASKYIVEANGAYNGSEQFGPNYRFAFFPSISAGWVISNEKFMKKLDFIQTLKLRGSYGKIGNDRQGGDQFSGRYLYRDQWTFSGNAPMGPLAQNSPYTFYSITQLGNPNIAWETVEKTNVGLDFGFLNGLVEGNLDVFRDIRSNIIIAGADRAIPKYFGQSAPNANLGKVQGTGFELELRFNFRLNNGLRLWANPSITHAVNKVLFRDDPELLPSNLKNAGYQLGQVKSYLSSGYLRSWDDVYGSAPRNANDQFKLPGDYNIIDYNGDGIVDRFDVAPYQYSGSPQNTYNLSLGIEWKGFSAFAQFYGVNNVTRTINFPTFDTYSASNTAYVEGTYWTKESGGNVPLPRWGALPEGVYATRYQYDGSYIRLRNAELAYTFSGPSMKKIGVKSFRVFVNGNNLALWTKMPDDRESNFSSGGGSLQGAYPTSKRYNLGIDVSF
ncbi:TonB-linked SusC/RagA family outer membrane protein [Mucilaginibacter auburnensis]|uniref:TonB-linked SusC/RagA family outer membrane protein n=2 Tax=Mucilaginibacter auburnensis TaxID=1457233 RepID=A0A2H9VNX7_9SPHI|nr:TonB-linked SusC/RagA family outer membrane protein [Mucilaginibacter auburnensis]